jgi:hypothetical protein
MKSSSLLVAAFVRLAAILTLLQVVAAPCALGQVSSKPPNYSGGATFPPNSRKRGRQTAFNKNVMPPAGSVLQFFDTPEYPVGGGPYAVASADFNGDGKPDLVVVNRNDNTVSVLLGNGDGTFQAHKDYATAYNPTAIAIGDFNGDGRQDLAVVTCLPDQTCSGGGSLSILLGNGDGTFQTHVDYAEGGSFFSDPNSVAVGDFNGDGKLDLVVANTFSCGSNCPYSVVSVLLGNGDGTFQAHKDYPGGYNLTSMAVGDFNGDGKLDLAVGDSPAAEHPSSVNVLLGNGDGSFQTFVPYILSSPGSITAPIGVAIGDLNGDGKADLVVTPLYATLQVLLGNGDGTFQTPVAYGTHYARSPVIGDFNGDGKLDVAFVDFTTGYGTANRTGVLLGNGDGTFGEELLSGTGSAPLGIAAGDFNRDGKLDLATADSAGNTTSVMLGNGDGSFQARADYDAQIAPSSIAVGDFNRDGKPDLAVANACGNDPGCGPSGTISILRVTATAVSILK